MHEEYLPKDPEGILSRLMEECAEVIQEGCKIQRFGWDSAHPTSGKGNIQAILEEIADLKHAIAEMERIIG
jgi:NTP pyrophosphatase (non-canonical NTP hydrolase)